MRPRLRHRALVLSASILSLLIPMLALADGDHERGERAPRHRGALPSEGWGMDFQINRHDLVTALNGATLAARWQRAPREAWRLALSAALHDEHPGAAIQATGGQIMVLDESANVQDWRLSLVRLAYPDPRAEVKFYYGLGPLLGFQRSLVTSTRATVPSGTFAEESGYERRWSAGLAAVAGVQWFATRSISVYGEYGLNGTYHESRGTRSFLSATPADTMHIEFESQSHGFDVNAAAFTLGMAVYF